MKHLIQNQEFLLTIPQGMDAFRAQHDASNYFRNKLLPALEQIFDELSGEDEVIRLDKLVIDLGFLSAVDLRDGNLDGRLYDLIKEELRRMIGKQLENHPDLRVSLRESILEQWWHYMERGYLPWNADRMMEEGHKKVLEMFSVDHAAITLLRKALQEKPVMLIRVSLQHTDWFLENLVAVLTSLSGKGLGATIDQFCRVQRLLEEKYRSHFSGATGLENAVTRIDGPSVRRAFGWWQGRMGAFLSEPVSARKAYVWRWLLTEAAARPAAFTRMGGAGLLMEWSWGGRSRESRPLIKLVLADKAFADDHSPFIELMRKRVGTGRDGGVVRVGEATIPGMPGEEMRGASPAAVWAAEHPGVAEVDRGEEKTIPAQGSEQEPTDRLPATPAGDATKRGTDKTERPGGGAEESAASQRRENIEGKQAASQQAKDDTPGRAEPGAEKRPEGGSKEKQGRHDLAGEGPSEQGSREHRGTDLKEEAKEKGSSPDIGSGERAAPDIMEEGQVDRVDIGQRQAGVPPAEKKFNEEDYLFKDGEITEEGIYIPNAGMILLHPFLSTFFSRRGLWQGGKFVDLYARQKAVFLLHFLATGEKEAREYDLVLPKLLSGYSLEMPLPSGMDLTEEDYTEGEVLLENAIERWEKLQNTSIWGLREGFLRRGGKLVEKAGRTYLQVEASGIDVLLDYLPWNLSLVKLPWLKEIIYVEWR